MIQVYRPETLAELFELLARLEGERRCLAGGTDLLVQAQDAPPAAASWLDVSAVPELRGISKEKDRVRIGSATTFADCAESPLVQGYAPALAQACGRVASPQVRNRATLGGNIAGAAPDADAVPALLSLDARVLLGSERGSRSIALGRFYPRPCRTVLRADEVILGFSVPAKKHLRGAFLRRGPRHVPGRSTLSLAVSAVLREGAFIELGIAVGAATPRPVRAPLTEALLLQRPWGAETLAAALETLQSELPFTDAPGASAAYRSHLAGVFLKRALAEIGMGTESAFGPE
ncbi:MAG: FAD binding domain-containing protein [Planctomycetes bacterium]|nr:FAD binding domain-containing protein [Planctomycetota bacterium]